VAKELAKKQRANDSFRIFMGLKPRKDEKEGVRGKRGGQEFDVVRCPGGKGGDG